VSYILTDPEHSTAHVKDAAEFLSSAEVTFDAGLFKASASHSCLSTIRSADAVCVAELSQQWKGAHAGAVALVAQTSLGQAGADLLAPAVDEKNTRQYQTVETSEAEALQLLEGARELHRLARSAVQRAGYPLP
jgi:uncharacterized protein (UPF0332 family)